jgi:hypothetical protein
VFTARVTGSLVRPPARVRAFVDELYKLGVLSFVIITVCGLAVGMVLGLQGYNTLVRFGATNSLGAVVGLALLREIGPLLTALSRRAAPARRRRPRSAPMVATEQLDGPPHDVDRPRPLHRDAARRRDGRRDAAPGRALHRDGHLRRLPDRRGAHGPRRGAYMSSLESSVNFRDDVVGSF